MKKTMLKLFLALVIAVTSVLSFVACGEESGAYKGNYEEASMTKVFSKITDVDPSKFFGDPSKANYEQGYKLTSSIKFELGGSTIVEAGVDSEFNASAESKIDQSIIFKNDDDMIKLYGSGSLSAKAKADINMNLSDEYEEMLDNLGMSLEDLGINDNQNADLDFGANTYLDGEMIYLDLYGDYDVDMMGESASDEVEYKGKISTQFISENITQILEALQHYDSLENLLGGRPSSPFAAEADIITSPNFTIIEQIEDAFNLYLDTENGLKLKIEASEDINEIVKTLLSSLGNDFLDFQDLDISINELAFYLVINEDGALECAKFVSDLEIEISGDYGDMTLREIGRFEIASYNGDYDEVPSKKGYSEIDPDDLFDIIYELEDSLEGLI